ncbi:MAG: hypothetical protein WCH99_00810 [Verrucomicrobiota bacterium]
MIRVIITDREVQFWSDRTGKQHTIRCLEHPAVFGHPRHIMVDFEAAIALLNTALKAVHSRRLFAPRVEVHVRRAVTGGLADVDLRTIKDFFVFAGAKDVKIFDP